MTALRGSCLCGGVRFEIDGLLMRSSHCHCRQCQRAHGAPFRTRARVAAADPIYEKAAAAISGLQVLPSARAVNDAKVGDHHAIIPTDEAHQLAGLSSDERRIYDMVAHPFFFAINTVLIFVTGLIIASLALLADLIVRSRGDV